MPSLDNQNPGVHSGSVKDSKRLFFIDPPPRITCDERCVKYVYVQRATKRRYRLYGDLKVDRKTLRLMKGRKLKNKQYFLTRSEAQNEIDQLAFNKHMADAVNNYVKDMILPRIGTLVGLGRKV